MNENIYYSNHKLLNLKDINGKKPEIFICDGNRTAGKSYSFKQTLSRLFFKKHKQFALIVRFQSDCNGYATAFFEDIGKDNFPTKVITEKGVNKGAFYKILIDGECAGYTLPLSMASKIKRYSGLFTDVDAMFFDEYQDENSSYLPNEVDALMSLHTTIARGHGKQSRYVPLYMASNTVSILNPYYTALGIHKRLRSDTKFLRGDGWVYERTLNTNASDRMKESAFNRAFADATNYLDFATENIYLNDNLSLIEKPSGASRYIASVKNDGKFYNVRQYSNCTYISTGYDKTHLTKVTANPKDITGDGFYLVNRFSPVIQMLKYQFECGLLRFEDVECKNIIFDLLTIK